MTNTQSKVSEESKCLGLVSVAFSIRYTFINMNLKEIIVRFNANNAIF